MTESQEKAYKRLNGIYGKLIQEEDFKGALAVQMQIIAFERDIELYNLGLEQKLLSPLN
jgi:hypothetical protein